MEIDKIYCGDSRDVLSEFNDGCIDLTVTSPPYDNLRKYGNSKSTWNSEMFKEIARQLYRITKDGGVVVWIVNDKTENGSKTCTSMEQCLYFKEIGFNVNDVMLWEKTNSMPVVKQPRYTDVFEYMFIFSKGKPKTFSPIMIPCKCAGYNYNSTAKKMGGENGRRELNYHVNNEKIKGNIWQCGIAQNKTNHPAVFPESLVVDHILSWSKEGDVVLDPFMGSGTTALAAIKNNRHYIGIDVNPDYCKLSEDRINDVWEHMRKQN